VRRLPGRRHDHVEVDARVACSHWPDAPPLANGDPLAWHELRRWGARRSPPAPPDVLPARHQAPVGSASTSRHARRRARCGRWCTVLVALVDPSRRP
jgi:hypothetical protein